MKSQRLRRLGRVLTFAGATAVVASIAGLFIPSSAFAVTQTTDSTRTYRWASSHSANDSYNYEALAHLEVTVGQTSNLTHQGVVVSWTGAPATSTGDYSTNFLQVMQCWGDDGAPSPQQCQFGAPSPAIESQVGNGVATRSLSTDADPNQSYSADIRIPPTPDNPYLRVYAYPFKPVSGAATFDVQQYFTSNSTNEVTAARTGVDGTGQLTFEVQTTLEAPHLGCGADVTQSDGTSFPRSCWLVVVPRTNVNVDGTLGSTNSGGRIAGSPFSASNWRDRISIPLGFQSVAHACPLGQHERRLVGSELVANAVTSWQPALCGGGTTYGYSLIGDSEARAQIVSDVEGASRLGFVSTPSSETEAKGATILYGPVTQSSIVVAYNIDYNLRSNSPVFSRNGTKLTNLVLNARLVAKLLTQSYQVDVPGRGADNPTIRSNPFSLNQDPEFITLNPDFAQWAGGYPLGLFVALGSTDFNRHVWEWIRSDGAALSFLKGESDGHGMHINPAYLALGLAENDPPVSFPKADLTTSHSGNEPDEPGYGTLDMRPYYNDLNETAYRALRADGNVKTIWDITKVPARYTALAAQPAGERFVLAITDSSSAARYGLDTAALVNKAGEAVQATPTSVSRGISNRKPSTIPGVSLPNFDASDAAAYPLSEVTYAAINVCATDAATRADYAKFLNYATRAGQVSGLESGNLPLGYYPLTAAQKKQTQGVISTLSSSSQVGALCPSQSAPSMTDTSGNGSDSSTQVSLIAASSLNGPRSTRDGNPLVFSGFSLLGMCVGMPMLIAGPLMTRRARRLEV